MKKSGKDRLKCAVYESTRAPLTRSPFPNGEGKEEGASPPPKEANPASLRSAVPSKGRSSRGHSLLPMEGGTPKGRRLDGGSGMKKSGKDRLKCAVYESTRAPLTRSPFPNGEGKEEGASPPPKEANPASLRSAVPSKGRSSRGHSLLPMEGGTPKGRRLDGGSGMKKSGKDRLKCAVYESTRAPLTRSPFPNGEGKEEGASPPPKEANPASLRSAVPSKGRSSRGHSLLPMEGGTPKGRRLDGGSGMKKSGKDRLKCAVYESTRAPLRGLPSPMGKAKRRRLHRQKRKLTPPRCARLKW